jgi:hypothetical protein
MYLTYQHSKDCARHTLAFRQHFAAAQLARQVGASPAGCFASRLLLGLLVCSTHSEEHSRSLKTRSAQPKAPKYHTFLICSCASWMARTCTHASARVRGRSDCAPQTMLALNMGKTHARQIGEIKEDSESSQQTVESATGSSRLVHKVQ